MRIAVPLAVCALVAFAGVAEAKTAKKPAPKPDAEASVPDPKPAPIPTAPKSRLSGLTTREITTRLGPPDVAHTEGKGAFWTYRLTDCALFVFFQDAGKGLKVSSVSAGPRKRGDPAPAAEDCLTAAETH